MIDNMISFYPLLLVTPYIMWQSLVVRRQVEPVNVLMTAPLAATTVAAIDLVSIGRLALALSLFAGSLLASIVLTSFASRESFLPPKERMRQVLLSIMLALAVGFVWGIVTLVVHRTV